MINKFLLTIATVLFFGTFAQGEPLVRPIEASAISLAQVFLDTSVSIHRALVENKIDSDAQLSVGVVTRFGAPGNYTDQYSLQLTKCGPTPTSPCRVEGTLTIKRWVKADPSGNPKIQYIVSAEKN